MGSAIRGGASVAGEGLDDQSRAGGDPEGARDPSIGVISCAKTDETGQFKLRGVDPGKRMLAVRAAGLAPLTHEMTVGRDEAKPLELRMNKGVTMRVRVVDRRGAPVPGANIYLEK